MFSKLFYDEYKEWAEEFPDAEADLLEQLEITEIATEEDFEDILEEIYLLEENDFFGTEGFNKRFA